MCVFLSNEARVESMALRSRSIRSRSIIVSWVWVLLARDAFMISVGFRFLLHHLWWSSSPREPSSFVKKRFFLWCSSLSLVLKKKRQEPTYTREPKKGKGRLFETQLVGQNFEGETHTWVFEEPLEIKGWFLELDSSFLRSRSFNALSMHVDEVLNSTRYCVDSTRISRFPSSGTGKIVRTCFEWVLTVVKSGVRETTFLRREEEGEQIQGRLVFSWTVLLRPSKIHFLYLVFEDGSLNCLSIQRFHARVLQLSVDFLWLHPSTYFVNCFIVALFIWLLVLPVVSQECMSRIVFVPPFADPVISVRKSEYGIERVVEYESEKKKTSQVCTWLTEGSRSPEHPRTMNGRTNIQKEKKDGLCEVQNLFSVLRVRCSVRRIRIARAILVVTSSPVTRFDGHLERLLRLPFSKSSSQFLTSVCLRLSDYSLSQMFPKPNTNECSFIPLSHTWSQVTEESINSEESLWMEGHFRTSFDPES